MDIIDIKLYAIRYGIGFKYGTEGTVLQGRQKPEKMIEDFPFCYYLAKVNNHIILFDTGFREQKLAKTMGVQLLPIEKEIKEVLGENLCVDTIVLTHSHWDHIQNIDLYPQARLIMTRATYEQALEEGTESIKDYLIKHKMIYLVDEEEIIYNVFQLKLVGGHTKDSSIIRFDYQGQKYCITGDECYIQRNMLENIPVGISVAPEKNKKIISTGHREGWIPLPFHDAKIFKRYKHCSENIIQIL